MRKRGPFLAGATRQASRSSRAVREHLERATRLRAVAGQRVTRVAGAAFLALAVLCACGEGARPASPGPAALPGGPLLDRVDRLCTFLLVGASDAAGYYAAGLNAPGGHGYARLLLQNDDAAYPDFAGRDLATLHPGVRFVDQAESGFTSDDMREKLAATIDQLDPGGDGCDTWLHVGDPGNDFNDDIAVLVDPELSRTAASRARANIAAMIDLVRRRYANAERGQTLVVTLSTIQDPTDGTGYVAPEFTEGFCELISSPAIPGDVRRTALANLDHWNEQISDEAREQGGAVLDQHAALFGHGLSMAPATYFHPDCSHPSDIGHDAIRRWAWWLLTGEWIPQPS